MKFNLQITEESDYGEPRPIRLEILDVNVTWEAWGPNRRVAIATKDGVVVAKLNTWDDFPIEILSDRIVISGETPEDSAYFELFPIYS